MIQEEFRKKLGARHKVLVRVWGAFSLSIFLHLFVGSLYLSNQSGMFTPSVSNIVRPILWVMAGLDILVLRGLWRTRFLSKEGLFKPRTKPQIPRSLQNATSPIEGRAAEVVSLYFNSKVVGFAFAAAIAIYGLVLTFLFRDMTDQYVLSLISLVLMVLERPSKEFLREVVKEVEIPGA